MIKTQEAIDESLEVLAVLPRINASISDYCAQEIAKANAHDAVLARMSRLPVPVNNEEDNLPRQQAKDLNIRCCGKYLKPIDQKLVEP